MAFGSRQGSDGSAPLYLSEPHALRIANRPRSHFGKVSSQRWRETVMGEGLFFGGQTIKQATTHVTYLGTITASVTAHGTVKHRTGLHNG